MGWRFRRSIKIGPFRWNLSKSGVGVSWGIPGFRYGINAYGRKYISLGIPGTGLYFFKYLGKAQVPDQSILTEGIDQEPSTKQSSKDDEPWWEQDELNEW